LWFPSRTIRPYLQATSLSGLHALRSLLLSHNLLYRLDDVSLLQTTVPALCTLSLRGCPLADAKSYVRYTLSRLTNLTQLDDVSIGPLQRSQAANSAQCLSLSLLRSVAMSQSGSLVFGDEAKVGRQRCHCRSVLKPSRCGPCCSVALRISLRGCEASSAACVFDPLVSGTRARRHCERHPVCVSPVVPDS
jgi:hypothetical protein